MKKSWTFAGEKGWFRRGTAVVTLVTVLGVPFTAAADRGGSRDRWERSDDDRRGRGRDRVEVRDRVVVRDRIDWRRHDDRRVVVEERHFHVSRPPANWRPEFRNSRHWHEQPGHGWRFQRRPGIWSPYYRWWWLDGRAVLALPPALTVVRYTNGYYQLVGDGFGTPYYWRWVPYGTAYYAPPPPPAATELAPDPEVVYYEDEAPVVASPVGRRSGSGSEAAGTLLGGAVGGLLGSTVGRGDGKIAGVLVGTLLGAIVGNNIGRSIHEADELHAAHVLEKNRTGQASSWVNPDTGAEVVVVPRRTYQRATGEYCREYQTEVVVGGERQTAYGTACRQPDGQWKIVK